MYSDEAINLEGVHLIQDIFCEEVTPALDIKAVDNFGYEPKGARRRLETICRKMDDSFINDFNYNPIDVALAHLFVAGVRTIQTGKEQEGAVLITQALLAKGANEKDIALILATVKECPERSILAVNDIYGPFDPDNRTSHRGLIQVSQRYNYARDNKDLAVNPFEEK